MIPKRNELEQRSWTFDMASWSRWMDLYRRFPSTKAADVAREQLRKIQQRWPHHIKESEIPLD